MFEQNESNRERTQAEYETVQEPLNIRRLMAGYAGAEAVEQWSEGIQHQPLSTVAEQVDIIKHGRKEDAEGQEDLNNVPYVTEEKAGRGHDHPYAHAKQNEGGKQNRNPKKINAPANPHEDQKNQ